MQEELCDFAVGFLLEDRILVEEKVHFDSKDLGFSPFPFPLKWLGKLVACLFREPLLLLAS